MITKDNKSKAIKQTQRHQTDVGSPEAQVAILTARIIEITEHLKSNKHDHMGRRGLLQMVGRRKKLLKNLEKTDFPTYKKVIEQLGLRK
jgi:small subunit ribosomal protein S15